MGTGIRLTLSYRDLKCLQLPVPPIEEQDQIARYLDWKISGIDRLITTRRQELANLEDLKKSVITRAVTRGNWERVRLKRVCTMRAGKNLTSEQINPDAGNYPVYGGNSIRGYYSDYNIDGKYILIGRQGALCGNVHRVSGKVWATDHAVITKFCGDVDINYAYYLLLYMNLNQYSSDTAVQPGLSMSVIKKLPAIIPPLSEQHKIAGYLDKICSKIDSAITNFITQIDTLKELKASLISDTVTGKIDVRNIPVPKQEELS